MPRYSFYDTKTEAEWDDTMSYEELLSFLKDNPHINQVFSPPALGDSVRLGIRKPDQGFTDLLKTIKKGNRGSKINTFR